MATRDYVGRGPRKRPPARSSRRAAPKRRSPLIPLLVIGMLLAGFGGFLYMINGKGDQAPTLEEQVRANKPKPEKAGLPQEKWSYMERLENKQVDLVTPPPQPGVLPPPPAETVTVQPEKLPKPVPTQVPQPGTPITAPKPATGAPVATAQEQMIDRKAERERIERELRAEMAREQAAKAKAEADKARARAEAEKTASDGGRYIMQCAALRSQDSAESLKARIAFTAGLTSSLQTINGANGTVYKVVVGPFNGKGAADAANRRLQGAGISGCIPRKQ